MSEQKIQGALSPSYPYRNNKNKKSSQKLANGQSYQMPNRQKSHASIESIAFIGLGQSILKILPDWDIRWIFSLL